MRNAPYCADTRLTGPVNLFSSPLNRLTNLIVYEIAGIQSIIFFPLAKTNLRINLYETLQQSNNRDSVDS